jgi:hypothetical protein
LSVFRRRREAEDEDEDQSFDESYDDELEELGVPPASADDEIVDVVNPLAAPVLQAEVKPTTGPWDHRDRPRDDDMPRVDLGGMRVPIPAGVEMRVEAQDDLVIAATLVDGPSQLMLHAFAAPKSSGIWDEVRNELAESLRQNGGSAEAAEGRFGPELRARIPDDGGTTQPGRFLGVDGPRWFLRGLLTGPAASDPGQAQRLEELFRQVVVNRGPDAMAPRDLIPLHLPRDIVESATPMPDADPEAPTLQLRERGPEITEIQ